VNPKIIEEIEKLEAAARNRSNTTHADNDGRAFRAALAQSKSQSTEAPAQPAPRRSALPTLGFTLAGAAIATGALITTQASKKEPAKPTIVVSNFVATPSPLPNAPSPLPNAPSPLPNAPSPLSEKNAVAEKKAVAVLTDPPFRRPNVAPKILVRPVNTKQIAKNNLVGDDAFLNGDGAEAFARQWGTLSESDAAALASQWEHNARGGGDDFVYIAVPSLAGVNNAGVSDALRRYQQERQIIDTKLQHRVSLGLKGESFGDLCAVLSREAGIDLTAARTVADDKVTIFCKDRPVRELLREIVNLFGFVVERTGPEESFRYRLTQPLRARLLEEELRNRDASEALLDLDRQLETLHKLADNRTPEELRAQAENATAKEKAQLETLSKNGWGATKLYANLGQEELAGLRAGKVLRFAGSELPESLRSGVLSSQIDTFISRKADGRPEMDWGEPVAGAVHPDKFPGVEPTVTLSLLRNELGQFTLTGSAGGVLASGPNSNFKWNNQVTLGVGASPSSRSPENAKLRASRAKEPAFQKPVTAEKDAGNKNQSKTTADALERLFNATGRDIIADYYTRLIDLDRALPIRKTASLFNTLCTLSDVCKLRWDEKNGMLLFRSASFFNDRPKEVPNRLIQKWVKNRESGSEGALLENIFEMVQLRDEQLSGSATAEGLVALYGLEEWRLAQNPTLLENWRLVASLPSPLRAATLTERGVSFGQLAPTQKQRFIALTWHENESDAEEILSNPEQLAKLGDAALRLRVNFAAKTDRERAMFYLTAPALNQASLFFVNQSRSGGMDMPARY
jgi:hypothetical protein